jgi:hypothetical protein
MKHIIFVPSDLAPKIFVKNSIRIHWLQQRVIYEPPHLEVRSTISRSRVCCCQLQLPSDWPIGLCDNRRHRKNGVSVLAILACKIIDVQSSSHSICFYLVTCSRRKVNEHRRSEAESTVQIVQIGERSIARCKPGRQLFALRSV